MKVVLGAFNKYCLKLSRAIPGFLWSYSPDEVCFLIAEARKQYADPIFLSMDGSAFDSNQHADLLKAVDQ